MLLHRKEFRRKKKKKQKLLLRVNWRLAVRAPAFNPSILGGSEFKANLVYKVSSKTVRAVTHRNTVEKSVNWIILALARHQGCLILVSLRMD